MSRMKDHVGARGGRLVRVTPRRPCPVCHHGKLCSVTPDGARVLCGRVPSGQRHTNALGDFWVHELAGPATGWTESPAPASTTRERASADVRDAAYRAVRASTRLLPTHRANLHARGLTDEDIARNGYTSLEVTGRAAIARAIVAAVGEANALGVPGVYAREDGGRRWLSFAGACGLGVPVRDVEGRTVAYKVRRDEPGDGPRYLYISSAKHGGPSAAHAVHVPRFDGDRATLRITEGELKADVITALTGTLTISVPGVGSWALALPVLRALGAQRVKVAFDADHRTNPAVGRALVRLVHALRRDGYAWSVETWNPAHKGLDDLLVNQRSAA